MKSFFLLLCIFLFSSNKSSYRPSNIPEDDLVIHIVESTSDEFCFFWKGENGANYLNFQNLKTKIKKERSVLIFAVNGGMYKKTAPQGLFVEDGITKSPIDRSKEGYSNFYLQPNSISILLKIIYLRFA